MRDGGRQEAARKEQKREGEKGEERERVKEGGWDGGIEGGREEAARREQKREGEKGEERARESRREGGL